MKRFNEFKLMESYEIDKYEIKKLKYSSNGEMLTIVFEYGLDILKINVDLEYIEVLELISREKVRKRKEKIKKIKE